MPWPAPGERGSTSSTSTVTDVRVVVGRIARAHGVRGEVAVEVRTDEPALRFADGAELWAGNLALSIETSRRHQGRLLVSFAKVNDRNAAEALQGAVLEAEVDPEAIPDEPDAYYDRQLIGLEVRDAAGARIGEIDHVEHLPAQDLLVVRGEAEELRIPFVAALVPIVDIESGHVQVADIPGLLDLDEALRAD